MRTMILASMAFLWMTGSCLAQTSTAAMSRIETQIQPQTLGSALKEFAQTRHMQVLYLAAEVENIRTPGASGRLTADEALSRLLNGTGLTYRYIDPNAISIMRDSKRPQTSQDTAAAKSDHRSRATNDKRGASGSIGTDPAAVPNQGKGKPVTEHKLTALQAVVVTGTHIAGVKPIAPVMTITAEDIQRSGLPDLASTIRAQPEFYSGGANVGAIVGGGVNAGEPYFEPSTANLRGIGANSTLTLLDGQRLAGNAAGEYVDLSAIPTAAIERVEVDTSGASAVYGADAVAGVVNIILRKNYDGEKADAYIGGTMDGGLVQRYSALAGKSFEQHPAGVLIGYQFQSMDEILASQRDVSRGAGATTAIQPQEKTNALFLSAHYGPTRAVTAHIEGVYNHRTSVALEEQGDNQYVDDQFAITGGLKWLAAKAQTVAIDLTSSGDSASGLVYAPSLKIFNPIGQQALQNRLLELSLTGQGQLISLPGSRAVLWAAGAGYSRSYADARYAHNSPPAISASRHKQHVYAELNIPIFPADTQRRGLNSLTVNVAGRHEHYSDFGSITVPKIGLAYSPIESITFSATWGKSFQPPTLYQSYAGQQLIREPGRFFAGVSPSQEVLIVNGSNRELKPQTARTSTVTLEWRPVFASLRGMDASISYYTLDFRRRINLPITNFGQAVSNPLYAPFVVLNPSAALQAEVASGVASTTNVYNLPVAPADVAALVFDTEQNLSRQTIHGIDANFLYRHSTAYGELMASAAGSWLSFDQETIPGSGLEQISGTIFNPPRFRARVMFGWERRIWGANFFVNHLSGETNTITRPPSRVCSWTTVDAQMRVAVNRVTLALSADNLLNKSPPSIPPVAGLNPAGIGFDADNYSAVGRYLSLYASMAF